MAAAHFHCHAPTCLSVAMYNNATGELICREEPLYGATGTIHNQARCNLEDGMNDTLMFIHELMMLMTRAAICTVADKAAAADVQMKSKLKMALL